MTGTGGTLLLANFSSNQVLNVDGVTSVPVGMGYVAAIFVGVQSNSLSLLGGSAGFISSGRFFGGTRTVPFASAGSTVYAQVRVWDSTIGSTYDEVRALGGRHGASEIFQVTLAGATIPPSPPSDIDAMSGFSLTAGTGLAGSPKTSSVGSTQTKLGAFSRSGGANTFVLSGQAGATFAVEGSTDLVNWTLIDHVVNNSGAVKFVDESAPSAGRRFYRARLVSP
jgi:hypothetical protein